MSRGVSNFASTLEEECTNYIGRTVTVVSNFTSQTGILLRVEDGSLVIARVVSGYLSTETDEIIIPLCNVSYMELSGVY
ncbi:MULTISPECIES: hypothetical protein [Cytobacillus]|uniref:Uncharacterized protein n=1 Tax=Cytobacillus kochii TaxID=859143 RepID=A0A248TNT4_9BACI|nr:MULTISPECIES: hypothetical protein [Cytobacillus]ASV69822.1 hypothetical protein CKF48_22430 [Cytobacillus kochii]MEA1852170.1 hypothetical protein [Cytobacillus sp. OWB-43]MED1606699.1 hypothetical protein [Cytobacillus kochii]